jgi:hypothetical protein
MKDKRGCKICGKTLKDADAILGPDCQAHFDDVLLAIGTTDVEISRLFLLNDPTVDMWLRRMRNAIYEQLRPGAKRPGAKGPNHLQWANTFLNYARQRAEHRAQEESIAA